MAVLAPDGTTCAQKAINMAKLSPGSNECKEQVYFWRNICCAGGRPKDVAVAPTPAPVVSGQGTGPNPVCHICRGGDFPGNPSMVINMLYIGASDCKYYYDSGRRGNLPAHLCDPLQYFAYEPCGCGEFNNNVPGAPPADSPAGSPNGGQTTRKDPNAYSDGKEDLKMSNQRGGAGGRLLGGGARRGLKGKIYLPRDH